MADPLTQAQIERRFAEIVRRVMGARVGDVTDVLANPTGDWQAALDRLYAEIQAQLADEFAPLIERGLIDSAALASQQAGVAFDLAALGKRAETFASRYTFDLVKGITDTTRDRLSDAVVKFLESDATDLRQLGETIGGLFGPSRGQTIATTEATRAAAQGQRILVEELKAESPDAEVVEVWQTSEDEIVCEICGEGGLSGVARSEDGYFHHPRGGRYSSPPAHPNCRCAVRVVVLSAGGQRVS